MLLTHAIAAQTGHDGPTRRDARARILVDRLTAPPVWLGAAGTGRLSTCWSRDLDRVKPQHPSLEPKVAEALARAWRAREQLGLASAAVARIESLVTTCARSAAWRHVRVANQINWNAELYASASVVSGSAGLLRHEYRRQLAAFAADRRNWGAGFQFHYQPKEPETAGINLDSPEYANIVVHALGHYDEALRRGMRPLPGGSMRRLRAWVRRLLAGSWTHAGYLNWDTGKGRRRWHSAQYWAFAQQGLLAIATSPRFWAERRYGRWAKALFDRGLELYERRAAANGGLAPKHMFGVHTLMEEFDCFCARMIANAARAVALGLGSRPAQEPPPLYAFDPDTGRLAVTTPRYSTAIVPDTAASSRTAASLPRGCSARGRPWPPTSAASRLRRSASSSPAPMAGKCSRPSTRERVASDWRICADGAPGRSTWSKRAASSGVVACGFVHRTDSGRRRSKVAGGSAAPAAAATACARTSRRGVTVPSSTRCAGTGRVCGSRPGPASGGRTSPSWNSGATASSRSAGRAAPRWWR